MSATQSNRNTIYSVSALYLDKYGIFIGVAGTLELSSRQEVPFRTIRTNAFRTSESMRKNGAVRNASKIVFKRGLLFPGKNTHVERKKRVAPP